MNLVVLQGNLTRDPDVRTVNSKGRDIKVATFTVATNRHFTKADGTKDKETTFTLCEAWDSGAATIEQILHKGDPVLLEGSIKNESWDGADGQKHYRTKVRVSNFTKLYRALKQDEEAPANPKPEESQEAAAPEAQPIPADAGTGKDIPF